MTFAHSSIRRYFRSIALCVAFLAPVSGALAEADSLQKKHIALAESLSSNVYGIPIYLESGSQDRTMHGDVYGVIPHSFDQVRDALGSPLTWCQIVPQHINIKACTYQMVENTCQLNFYTGRKYYMNPERVFRIKYQFERSAYEDNYFKSSLVAQKGPLDTKKYYIYAEAVPIDGSSTFIHFSYSYAYGLVTHAAMNGYFASLGNNKKGFSTVDISANGEPVYVEGVQGVAERNVMRYYFAIQSYLDSLSADPDKQFEASINRWFELTEKYPEQLYEMDKVRYLEYKRKEHADQLRMQASLNLKDGNTGNEDSRSVCGATPYPNNRITQLTP
ncbi:MAG: hypothetical protein OEY67_00290 [Gammaproteobacteria bacterium]|nr:hypothetical protein [Gammaproteobacteria bacterium]